MSSVSVFFFFNDTATTEIYTLPYTTLFRSQVAPDVDDVERARALGHEVRPREPPGRLREREGRAIDEPAARDAELPGERGQREDRADAAAAVLVSLEPVAHADRRAGERVVPL